MAQIRMQEIADLAGVSVATVSRVLNNKPLVSPANRDRVIRAVRRLGGGVLGGPIAGLILPDHTNPFFTELAFRLQLELQARGIHLLIASSEAKLDREISLLDQFKALGVAGLIYIGAGGNSEALLGIVAEGKLPVIALDRRVRAGNLDSVTTTSVKATMNAVSFLLAQGHKRIGYLHGLLDTEPGAERLQAFHDAMRHNGLSSDYIVAGDFSLEAGSLCGDQLAQDASGVRRPTAMLVANDLMAIGLAQRLQELGWELPGELSIIGYDDIPWSAAMHPALTTIQQPFSLLVAETARLLETRLAQYSDDPPTRSEPVAIVLDCPLIVRRSVRAHSEA